MKQESRRKSGEDADNKPYESLDDWKKDVAHLKWPSIILLLFTLILFLLLQLKIV